MTQSIPRVLLPAIARRLAISAQWLNRPRLPGDHEQILNVVRQLGCVQLDPISAVARSHQLVLWSRLGAYKAADLDRLLWEDRSLFEYWAHAASIVLTEDYPIHHALMRTYASDGSEWSARTRAWVQENDALRRHILDSLHERGPMLSREFEDHSQGDWYSTGWTSNRNVSQMLDYLWTSGQIMVVGRRGGQKVWGLAERALPEWTPRHVLDDEARVDLSVQKALRALGIAREKQINDHYTRGRYPKMRESLRRLEVAGRLIQVEIGENGQTWPGPWYVHSDSLPLLDRLEAGEWSPTTRLLSPFDNLICDRDRTEQLFDFRFRIEIYVPKAKREYGYYVLPILHGDRLIGRIDPVMNRKQAELVVNAVYAEPDAPLTADVGANVAEAVQELATFLGARRITYGDKLPVGWKSALRSL